MRYPSMMVCGCIFCATSFSASLNNSAANTHTLVVPSPTSSSCTFEMLTRILAAALSSCIDFKIVAPSFVTVMSPEDADCRILFMPFGPRVDLTRSPSASAPTNEERRAFSAFSSVAFSKIWDLASKQHITRQVAYLSTENVHRHGRQSVERKGPVANIEGTYWDLFPTVIIRPNPNLR